MSKTFLPTSSPTITNYHPQSLISLPTPSKVIFSLSRFTPVHIPSIVMEDHDNFLEGEGETDRPSASLLAPYPLYPHVFFLFFLLSCSESFFLHHSFSPLPFRFVIDRHLSSSVFPLVFVFLSFSPFSLHDSLGTSRTVPCASS